MNIKNILYSGLTIVFISLAFIYTAISSAIGENLYYILLLARLLIIFDTINIIRNPNKGRGYIKLIISYFVELILVMSGIYMDDSFIIAIFIMLIRLIFSLVYSLIKRFSNNSLNKESYIKKEKTYSSITTIITVIMFFIVAFYTSEYRLLILLGLEAIAIYDIKNLIKNLNKFGRYVNIIIYNIIVLLELRIIIEIEYELELLLITLIALRVTATIIYIIIKKIPILERNSKKILIGIIVVIIGGISIYISIINSIIIKIPYEFHSVMDSSNNVKWFKEMNKLKIISNINDFEKIYTEENIDEIVKDRISKDYKKTIQDVLDEKKEKVLTELKIDKQFFEKYYLIFVPMEIDYITYNKPKKEIKIVHENTKAPITAVMSYNYYFVKIEKIYNGNISYEIKDSLFDIYDYKH